MVRGLTAFFTKKTFIILFRKQKDNSADFNEEVTLLELQSMLRFTLERSPVLNSTLQLIA